MRRSLLLSAVVAQTGLVLLISCGGATAREPDQSTSEQERDPAKAPSLNREPLALLDDGLGRPQWWQVAEGDVPQREERHAGGSVRIQMGNRTGN